MKQRKIIVIMGVAAIILLSSIWVYSISAKSGSIYDLENENNVLENKLDSLNGELNIANLEILGLNSEIEQTLDDLNKTIVDLDLLRSGDKYVLHDPTFWECADFVKSRDQTDCKPYDEETFNCLNYAHEINNNSEKFGIRCAVVIINLSGPTGHACIAFNTTDRDIVYFEPKYDMQIFLRTGVDYWADLMLSAVGYYFPRDPNNIVEGFTLVW